MKRERGWRRGEGSCVRGVKKEVRVKEVRVRCRRGCAAAAIPNLTPVRDKTSIPCPTSASVRRKARQA